MDDGDINGRNQLFRLRSAKGHQFMMNDSNNFIYLIHANGQTWIELGQEGTIDVYSTNSVNVRSQGDVNIHADQDINMYAGRNFNIKAKNNFTVEAGVSASITAQADLKLYSKATIGVKADGTLALESASGSWAAGSGFVVSAGGIDFNGPAAPAVDVPKELEKVLLDSTTFSTSKGWEVEKDKLETIVPRAPTHEPWPYHNAGVAAELDFEEGQPDPPPGAEPVPAGVEIVKTA
jgi:hypothetical protein